MRMRVASRAGRLVAATTTSTVPIGMSASDPEEGEVEPDAERDGKEEIASASPPHSASI